MTSMFSLLRLFVCATAGYLECYSRDETAFALAEPSTTAERAREEDPAAEHLLDQLEDYQ